MALATLGLAVVRHGKAYASGEARSMSMGALAFLLYAVGGEPIVASPQAEGSPGDSRMLGFVAGIGAMFVARTLEIAL